MSGRWDADTRTWVGWEQLGQAPRDWHGPIGALAPEPGLHAYQRRNLPLVNLAGVRCLGGPRPPYYSWHGGAELRGQPRMSAGTMARPGRGIHLLPRHAQARDLAGADGEVLAFYCNVARLVLFDGRVERTYGPPAVSRLTARMDGASQRGDQVLASLMAELGPDEGLTARLTALGFNGLVSGSTARDTAGWCVFDPRVFKLLLSTGSWSREEILRREAFDPTPIRGGMGWQEDPASIPVTKNHP